MSEQRSRFSLTDLAVVIAMFGLVLGLAVSAIQGVLEYGRQASCTNNLKQLGVAALSYHDAQLHFPPGRVIYEAIPPSGKATGPRGTVAVLRTAM